MRPEDMSDREILLSLYARMAAMDRDWFWFWRVAPSVVLMGAGWLAWLTVLVIGT